MFAYHAAGLTVAADAAIPWLPAANGYAHEPDLRIHVHARPHWHAEAATPLFASEYHDAAGRPIVSVYRSASGAHFEYADGTRFWIDDAASQVWTIWARTATLADTATYLAGPVFSYVLRMRGVLALHASAIQLGGAAVALVGGHGAGKSTTAAAFARRGCAVVTDDVLRIDRAGREWIVPPFGGPLRLWPEAAKLVGTGALPPLTPGWEKGALAMGAYGVRSAEAPLPLRALVLLKPRVASDAAPSVEPCSGSDALVQLAAHSSAAQLLDPSARASEFTALSDLVRQVPTACATAHSDGARLPAFVTMIGGWASQFLPGVE